jgi:DHA2 family multidrug resistance protein
MITPTAKTLQNPQTMGGWTIDTLPGLTAISKEITRQAVMIGYLNAFAMYTVACAAAIALAFLARGRPRAAGG